MAAPKVTAIGSISVVASFATATAVSSLTVKVIPEFSLGIVVVFVIEGVDEAESGAGIEVGVKVGVRVEVFPSKGFVPDSSTKNIKPAQYKNIWNKNIIKKIINISIILLILKLILYFFKVLGNVINKNPHKKENRILLKV